MTEQVFVARERQLAQLQTFLTRALAGQGQVCFVTGEAGAGKTALVIEFARRAQDVHADLLVAVGQCDAQTGIGDPYLPFREVLGMLTGDVEAKLAQGAITQENAGRLQEFLRVSGQALVDLGPDLIDIFVPGAGVATRAGAFVAGRVGWLDRLENLSERRASRAGGSALEQRRIFEQYTDVLQALSAERPLMLVVDDLHWADASSISLLFHLGRRITSAGDVLSSSQSGARREASRILLVGTYRPEDVGLGRAGEPHPLQDVVSEFKRYYGDISVDLGQAAGVEARQFVDALLDTEPNRLGEVFRHALLQHTGGHPLFTVELLRDMRERGDLRQDVGGRWVEAPTVVWDALPARVEGVIERRIGRLEEELRETLTVASVEGEDFTAQVVASVQAVRERQLLRELSQVLEKRHRLVRERGEVTVGDHHLSRYRFAHALFQQYVYNELSAGERRLLHREVAEVLEALYGDEADEVAVQLAHHFTQAKAWDKAFCYLAHSGDKARQAYANQEAVDFYTRAIEVSGRITPAPDEAQLLSVYEGRGLVWIMLTKYDDAVADFHIMRQLADASENQQKEGEALCHLANAHFMTFTEEQFLAEDYARQALQLSRQTGDQRIFARSQAILGFLHQARAELRESDTKIGEALRISRQEGFKDVLAQGVMMLGHQAYWQGDFPRAIQLAQEGVTTAREIDDGFNELFNLTLLSQSCASAGEYGKAHKVLHEALVKARERDNKFFIGRLTNTLGWFHYEFGDVAGALDLDLESVELGERYRISNVEISALINLGLDYGALGEYERALSYLEPTLQRVEQEAFGAHRWRWKVRLLIGLAETYYSTGLYEDALRYAEEGIEEALATSSQKYVAKGWALRGKLLAHRGEMQAAGSEFQRAFALAEQLGSPSLVYPLAHDLGHWYKTAGNDREATELYGKAKAAVEHMATAVGDEALRSAFVQSPPVQAVYGSFARTH
jgi:adenylate cyclase